MVRSIGSVLSAKLEAKSYFAQIPVLRLVSDGKPYILALVSYDTGAQKFLRVPSNKYFKVVLEILISGLREKFVFNGRARIEDFRETRPHTQVEIMSISKKEKFLLVFDAQSTWNFETRVRTARVVGEYEFVIDY